MNKWRETNSNLMYEEETDSFIPRTPKVKPTCKYCEKFPLVWRKVLGKWYLHELDGKIHNCPNHSLPLEVLKELAKKSTKKMNEINQLLPIPTWDEFFMRHVYLAASKSKDPRTKIGAVLVRDRIIISEGYNGFAREVYDLPERYLNRETKYKFVVHAECNSILNAARHGISTNKSILYTNGIPCDSCGKTIIQAGITDVIIHKQWPDVPSPVWKESVEITKMMFREAQVIVRVLDSVLGISGVVDGKIINV